MEPSPIAEFYRGRSVFITGATGFIGKVLVEKLLRSCPDIDRIYILMRPFKGKTAENRLHEFIDNQIFETVRNQQPDAMTKIVSIQGDVVLPGFGISPEDLELLTENVSVVFNSAANIKFGEKLKAAFNMNVKGPLRMLEICRQMKRLEVIVHVSTAYSNLDRDEIQEEVIQSIANPERLIDLVDYLDDTVIEKITKDIVGKSPNTYTYCKGLAEQLLEEKRGDLPLVIVRPSIVTAAVHEPTPGWIDNLNGVSGSVAALGTGITRVGIMQEHLVMDVIPVDFTVNLLIAVAWHAAIKRPNNVLVYSSATGQHNPITWECGTRKIVSSWLKFPTTNMLWYPNVSLLSNHQVYFIYKLLFHYLPAGLLDLVFLMKGNRMKWVRLYRKIDRAYATMDFFTTHQWRFLSNNWTRVLKEMSSQDQNTFYFDVRKIDWSTYVDSYVLGVRRYILKENPSTINRARVKLTRFFVARIVLIGFILLSLLYCFKNYLWVIFSIGAFVIAKKFISSVNRGHHCSKPDQLDGLACKKL